MGGSGEGLVREWNKPSTRPIAFCPGTKGRGYVKGEWLESRKLVVCSTSTARILTTIPPGTARGLGRVWSTRSASAASLTSAFMLMVADCRPCRRW
jgi:hypothetical protein